MQRRRGIIGRLAGRVAIVTGGGAGIGRGIAMLFAREGARVVIATRTEGPGEEALAAITAEGGEAMLHLLDMGDPAAVQGLVAASAERFGGIDIVLHNAAFLDRAPLATMSDASLDRMFDVGVKAAFWLTRAALPWLERSAAPRILVTSSVAGNRTSIPHQVHYGAAKMAVTGFVRGAALELAPAGITVNAVEPGLTVTPALHRAANDAQIAAMAQAIPLGRAATPDDIAAAFLFLASDEAGHITGQTLTVDGGATLGRAIPLQTRN
jgi:3-oxoacyl-[acyl-carrier protein] reductase